MAVRKFKPTTPGQRHKIIGVFKNEISTAKNPFDGKAEGQVKKVSKITPEKSLTVGKRSTGGRNDQGALSTRYRGGGHKRKLRLIDFKRNNDGVPAVVKTIEYDPNRSARIALLYYKDGSKAYIIAPNGLQVGQIIESGSDAAPEVGNTLPLAKIPVGTLIHCIELRPGQGASMARSAGAFAQLTSREGNYAIIKLPSGETRKVLLACRATIGVVGNSEHSLEQSGKAGRTRWLGRRPHNRGVVMNPVDHPMGGGEGRQSGGHPRSRTGLYAKGLKTRSPKKHSSKYIIERRKK
ncbi:MAG: 50S ribosomal protein L2 [Prevotella sp.]|nr:50S ribosomal protein L2 [Bacteroides sp.]MCM1366950.1 50S ribosomal protein L2 [Prevotella sp.]MCM1436734.1 50S ribosomal protein L2 [Prevotella sp.]